MRKYCITDKANEATCTVPLLMVADAVEFTCWEFEAIATMELNDAPLVFDGGDITVERVQ